MSVKKNTPNFLKHSGLSFTTIINQTMDLIKDDGALGIYCYLSSKPQNWEICQIHLANRFGKGRDYIRNKIKILKNAGLIKTESIRDEKGHIIRWETSLLNCLETQITENTYSGELSTDNQITEIPTSGENKFLENQALVIKDIKQIKDYKKIKDKSFCTSNTSRNPIKNKYQKQIATIHDIRDNGLRHEWAPMKNEQANIKQNEKFKRVSPPIQLKEIVTMLKRKCMVQI